MSTRTAEAEELSGFGQVIEKCKKCRECMTRHAQEIGPDLETMQKLEVDVSKLLDQAERNSSEMQSLPEDSQAHGNATAGWKMSMKAVGKLVKDEQAWMESQRSRLKSIIAELTKGLELLDASIEDAADFRESLKTLDGLRDDGAKEKKKEKSRKKSPERRSSPSSRRE